MGWTYELVDTFHPDMMDVIVSAITAPIKGGAFIAESIGSAAGYATGITDGERIRFDLRFSRQIGDQGYKTLKTLGKTNPIKRIFLIVIGHVQKSNPSKYAKAVAEVAAKYGIKKVAIVPFIEAFSDLIAGYVVSRYAAMKSMQGGISGALTMGVGAGLTAASIFDNSYYAARDLRIKNPSLYQKLYSQNLECFWFLVQKQLNGFV